MYQLTENIITLLGHLAGLLPQLQINSTEKHLVKGSEILSWETVKEIDGKPIDPDHTYTWNYPVITVANHYRRLKNKYKKKGIPGVKQYLEWIVSLQNEGEEIEQLELLKEILKELDEDN